MSSQSSGKITILGIGNILFRDEGVGVHILPLLERVFEKDHNVEIIEGSTDGMKLLGPIEDAESLVIIDAINAGKSGGELIKLVGEEIPAYFGVKMSVHQLGFQEVLMAAKIRERYPERIIMYGMQPSSLELGIGMSETNESRMEELASLVVRQVHAWRRLQ